MLKELIRLAHRLDALGHYDLADELDIICREAADQIDMEKLREFMEGFMSPEKTKQLEAPDNPEDDHVPDEKVKPLFYGKKDERDPDELSEEELPDRYLETRVEDIEDYRDPERDLISEYMEQSEEGR